MLYLTTIFILLLAALFYYIHHKYIYWTRRRLTGPRPIFPFGNLLTKALCKPNEIEVQWQAKYGTLYGIFTGLAPTLTIADVALIKQVLIEDFTSLTNRRHYNSYHKHWNENVMMAEDGRWRRLRAITSPSFSLAKLRTMIPLMEQCVDKLVMYFEGLIEISTTTKNQAIFTPKSIFSGYTIDIIALTAFATETNANLRSSSPLVDAGKRFFQLSTLKILAILVFPRWFLDLLGIRQPFNEKLFNYFTNFARHILAHRRAELKRASGQKRNDLVQLLLDSCCCNENNFENNNLTEDEIIAQCIVFLAAGFETTASTLTHCIFELVHNEATQEKLFHQLKELKANHCNSKSDYYDALLNQCPYLEATLKETLRKYSPATRLERRVGVTGYSLAGLPLDIGTLIEISITAVHYNPTYWPDPAAFNPDRFMPANAQHIVPFSYLPFGDGPRNCLGVRFALQEMKLCLAAILTRFKFSPTIGTPKQLDFILGIPMLNAKPFEVQVVRRERS